MHTNILALKPEKLTFNKIAGDLSERPILSTLLAAFLEISAMFVYLGLSPDDAAEKVTDLLFLFFLVSIGTGVFFAMSCSGIDKQRAAALKEEVFNIEPEKFQDILQNILKGRYKVSLFYGRRVRVKLQDLRDIADDLKDDQKHTGNWFRADIHSLKDVKAKQEELKNKIALIEESLLKKP